MPARMCLCGHVIETEGARECDTCAGNRIYAEFLAGNLPVEYGDDVLYADDCNTAQSSVETQPIRQQPHYWRGEDRRRKRGGQ